jgi:uncharacterized membrane-anchored protein
MTRLPLLSLLFAGLAYGGAPPAPAPAPTDPPPAVFHWQPGPAPITLGHELELALPAEYIYLGGAEAKTLMEKLGSFHNENLLGVVASKNEQDDWVVVIRYEDEGFIKDSEKIDADELLKAIREGTEEANTERTQHGFPALKIDGWSEQPRYEQSLHHLVWALLVSSTDGTSVNYNTRVLGRKGYVSLNLVTDPAKLAAHKPNATKLLAATTFKKGSRYEDFNSKTDKVAEYGLMGLILGGAGLGAAKLVKIGLLAKFGKVLIGLLVAGKKLIVLLFVGIWVGVKKLFGVKTPPAQASNASAPPSSTPPPSKNDDQLPPTGTGGPPAT